jgi:hypothetical protein
MKLGAWIRINHSMAKAAELAVEAGLAFAVADFSNIGARMRGGYWLHHEPLYRAAVEADNLTACKSIEHALERRPWVLGSRRIFVGADTPWGIATSIEDGHFIACVYRGAQRSGKPLKRNRVTRDMVAAKNSGDRKARAAKVTCKRCDREQPDHRTGSAWVTEGTGGRRRPDDRCQGCGENLPGVAA